MIYHLTTADHWQAELDKTEEDYRHPSLATEGFIHCCTKEQVPGVVQRHFTGHEELMILYIVERRLAKDLLKWEESPSVGESFPHIYGAIPLDAIEDLAMLVLDPATGQWDWVY